MSESHILYVLHQKRKGSVIKQGGLKQLSEAESGV